MFSNQMPPKEVIRQMLISIAVGACIAFITTLMQGLLGFLQHLNDPYVGSVGGVTYYLTRVVLHRNA